MLAWILVKEKSNMNLRALISPNHILELNLIPLSVLLMSLGGTTLVE